MSKSGSRRGGSRPGGGRPSKWRHPPTETVRVPEVFAETVREIAKLLDQGAEEVIIIDPTDYKVSRQVKQEKLLLSNIRVYQHSRHKVVRIRDLIKALQAIEGE